MTALLAEPDMGPPPWQFSIDVGGTFTDCIGLAPDGRLLQHKLLSSGVTRGRAGRGSDAESILDAARSADPPDFWVGFELRLLSPAGKVVATSRVGSFERARGRLRLATPLPISPPPDAGYELAPWSRRGPCDAPVLAIRYLLGLPPNEPLPPISVRLGTTRGTNALLTRSGARTAFITTRGFADILRIGNQNRPRLFELAIRKPEPLFTTVVEIDERVTPQGEVLVALDVEAVRRQLGELQRDGIASLAVCLLHAYCQPRHEQLIGQLARELGFEEISLSSEVAPIMKIVSRGDTTVVDAYLNPVLRTYVKQLDHELGNAAELRLLTSAGGLVSAGHFAGKDSILSGPAGGVVGFSKVARAAGFDRAIGFDMGGTSTDVSRFDGRFDLEYETEKAGVRIVAPMLAIETVAAGGGSICRFDGVKLVVGPESAGADPGPACYGRGGPLAVTDMNLVLGRIATEDFPFPLDRDVVQQRLGELSNEVERATGRRYSDVMLADGFVRVANGNMAKAIRSISVAKGYDPREYALVCFGGAAPQHVCAVASELGIRQILCHPQASILSAYGIGMADVVRHRSTGVYRRYDAQALKELQGASRELLETARREVLAEGIAPERIRASVSLDLRYEGTDAALTIEAPADGDYRRAFAQQHQRLYGYDQPRELEIVTLRVEVVGCSPIALGPPTRVEQSRRVPESLALRTAPVWFDGQPMATPVFSRSHLQPGDELEGPALIVDPLSTTVIDPGWSSSVLSDSQLLLRDISGRDISSRDISSSSQPVRETTARPAASSDRESHTSQIPGTFAAADPVLLEIFNNHFAAIAEQMGITLRNTSSSINVKERLDFSCALFTPRGELVANAPHIPVHLGAMGETVRHCILDNPEMQPGDVFVTNDPYRGGSHLPDVTVVTPVHDERGQQLLFFTANRAHHAEIGGITPGSMPPFSRNLAEEGVLIRNFKVVAAGASRLDTLRGILLGAPYPTRAVTDNLADLRAQIAANQRGARDLLDLIHRHGLERVQAYMGYIQVAAEQKVRRTLARLPSGRREFVDHLDDGSPIAVAITVDGDEAVLDFTGTGPVLAPESSNNPPGAIPRNLNANRAIVTAAVMYVLRCLLDEDIPLNHGVLAPVKIVLPECLLHPPAHPDPQQCAAVAGGNVETSQRVVDVLLGALGIAAASQGTMNNLLFGDASFGYYETICGGAGATRDADGADAVHTHMTNTRLTDPEVLEHRFPVRVREFSIRRGSGGAGRRRGGDGVVRRLEFLRPVELSLLTQRRGDYPPYGLEQGQAGAIGRNVLEQASGSVLLSGCERIVVAAGDILRIETPGGGGFGHTRL